MVLILLLLCNRWRGCFRTLLLLLLVVVVVFITLLLFFAGVVDDVVHGVVHVCLCCIAPLHHMIHTHTHTNTHTNPTLHTILSPCPPPHTPYPPPPGNSQSGSVSSVFAFNVTSRAFAKLANMSVPRSNMQLIASNDADGSLYAIGGQKLAKSGSTTYYVCFL